MTQIAFCPPLKGVRGMAFMNLIIDFVSNLSLSFLIFYFLTASQERGGYVNILNRTHARLTLHRSAVKRDSFSSGTRRAGCPTYIHGFFTLQLPVPSADGTTVPLPRRGLQY